MTHFGEYEELGYCESLYSMSKARQRAIWLNVKPALDRYFVLSELDQVEDPAQLPQFLSHPNQGVRDKAARKLYEIGQSSESLEHRRQPFWRRWFRKWVSQLRAL